MGRILGSLEHFFETDGWNYEQVDDKPVLVMHCNGDNANWRSVAQALEDREQAIFYSLCPLNCPEAVRPQMAEFVTRANYGTIIGNFEMDFSDGEIRYKTSIDVEGVEFVPELIRSMVYANCSTLDRYMPGIQKVIAGAATPEEAVAEVESAAE